MATLAVPTPSRPRALNTPRASSSTAKRDSTVFRPRLPQDPFANAVREPLLLPAERLASASTPQPRHDVLLVLGEPSPADLSSLLRSERLAFSLLIIATHTPIAFPLTLFQNAQPAVRILALSAPLALELGGALRLVNVLEWAERVARAWRRSGGIGCLTLSEDATDSGLGALTPPSLFGSLGKSKSRSTPPSPSASTESVRLGSSASSLPGNESTSTLGRLLRKRTSSAALPAPDPNQRPFDGLLHFLPAGLPDKALLKQAILLTTISRPFLVAATPMLSTPPIGERRRSFFSRGSIHSVYSLPPTPPQSSRDSLVGLSMEQLPIAPPAKAHLMHLLPSTRTAPRLIESIEGFLISFSFPATRFGSHSVPSNLSALASAGAPLPTARPQSFLAVADGSSLEPARTFLLPASALSQPVAAPPHLGAWTLGDAVLAGVLDTTTGEPRAYFAGAHDVRVVGPLPAPRLSVGTTANKAEEPGFSVSPPSPRERRASYAPPATRHTSPPPSAYADVRSQVLGVRRPALGQLPTPPDSEEDGLSGRGSDRESGSASTGSRDTPKSKAAREARRRWMFWRRISTQ